MKLSIIIPARNEASGIGALLTALQPLRQRGHEVIVVDGASEDDTPAIARPLCDKCLLSKAGRAVQMRSGTQAASGEVLWFLHADSSVPANADKIIAKVLATTEWGGFPVRLSGRQRLLRIIERLMNTRSRLTGILTGDQGIFVTRQLLDRVGGFCDIPLMEDIDLSARLKSVVRPLLADAVLVTSSRRWEAHGAIRTIVRMWLLRLAFYLGVPARHLAPYYA
jgi:rSAM/selenodomain-associated transferase 2